MSRWAVIIVFLVLFAAPALAQSGASLDKRSQEAILTRREMHQWERHVRGFRREHNFALSSGITSGVWHVKRLGSITEERRFDNSGVYGRFQYSFHLPVWGGFGYMLGSSFGYHYESADRRRQFRPVSGTGFPGVLAGLVFNFNPVFRIGSAFDASLERHNGIEERPRVCEPKSECKTTKISVTMQSYDLSGFLDIFYDLAWAVRIEAHRRELQYQRPDEAETYPVDANFRKADRWLGVGFVLHLL